MDREGGLSPWLVAGLVAIILVIGALAYYAGRFRAGPNPTRIAETELPEPGPPAPDIQETIPTPGDAPPTVTPSTAVLIERGSSSTGRYVQRSSQVVVPVAEQPVPTALPSPIRFEGPPRSRISVEVPPPPRPSPTPTVPELGEAPREERPGDVPTPQVPESPPPVPTPEPPAESPPEPEPTEEPEPAPTPGTQISGG